MFLLSPPSKLLQTEGHLRKSPLWLKTHKKGLGIFVFSCHAGSHRLSMESARPGRCSWSSLPQHVETGAGTTEHDPRRHPRDHGAQLKPSSEHPVLFVQKSGQCPAALSSDPSTYEKFPASRSSKGRLTFCRSITRWKQPGLREAMTTKSGIRETNIRVSALRF